MVKIMDLMILKNLNIFYIFLYQIYKLYKIIIGEKTGNFDIVIENDNFSKAYNILREFVMSNLKQG